MIDPRREALGQWFAQELGLPAASLETVSADASFRRYFRYRTDDTSYILVDAPPATENNGGFVALAGAYADAGLMVPRVLFADLDQGFLCLTDLGDQLMLGALNDDNRERCYGAALRQLALVARVTETDGEPLPAYDRAFLQRELGLFDQWFLSTHLGIALTDSERAGLDQLCELLLDSALEQPQVGVHRDYHSRNLMMVNDLPLGIIDFQDSVRGPITYDAVSLLRDCYVRLPASLVAKQLADFKALLIERELMPAVPAGQFRRWFDWMGLQRHLKVCGIFSRLHHRDGKSGYLGDLPLVVDYLLEVSGHYPELGWLTAFLAERVLPRLAIVNEEIS